MATFYGKSIRDSWSGTSGNDVARGGAGSDTLHGQGGNDRLYGDDGNDTLHGGDGNDEILGGLGVDALHGGTGDDWLDGGAGNDYISGGAGNNKMFGGSGNDTLVFTHRADYAEPDGTGMIDGGAGYDTLVIDVQGAVTQDRCREVSLDLNSTSGKGYLGIVSEHTEPVGLWFGSVQGIEEIRLAPGCNPVAIQVGQGMKVTAGPSADFLYGGQGDQTFIGGAGSDTFRFDFSPGYFSGHDEVLDFSLAQGDTLQFHLSDPSITTKVVEEAGHTIYSAFDSSGGLMGTVEVSAIGLPPVGSYEIA